MKYQKILGLVATAGLLLAGCATDSDNSNTWLSDPNAVHVSASVGSIFTRSNPAASDEDKQKSFNTGDVMGVSNNGTSITYTYNKGTNDWQPGNGSYLVWDASDLNFHCWYPADGKNTSSKGYIQEDQSNETEIAKSDYMTAAVTNLTEIPGNRQLDVTLVRKTARLILNIQNFNDQFDASTTKVNHIRIASKASTDAGESSIVNIKPLQKGEGGIGTTYTALVIPGKVEGKLYFTTDESTETPLVVKTGTLEAGKSYTYNLIVGKNKVTIGNVTVAEWGKGDIEGGKAFYAPYVTFTAKDPQTFKMTTEGDYAISGLEYSLDGNNWTAVEKDKEVEFGGAKGSLRLRGKNPNGTASSSVYNYSNITFTHSDVKVACTGDIRTLLDWEYYKTVDTQNARFYNLFDHCTALTSAPEFQLRIWRIIVTRVCSTDAHLSKLLQSYQPRLWRVNAILTCSTDAHLSKKLLSCQPRLWRMLAIQVCSKNAMLSNQPQHHCQLKKWHLNAIRGCSTDAHLSKLLLSCQPRNWLEIAMAGCSLIVKI